MLVKQEFTYHNHTYRCGHAAGSERQMLLAARECGYKYIGISDHAPFIGFSQPRDRMEYSSLEDYLQTMNKLQKEFTDIEVVIGFEAEYCKDRLDELKALRERCDYLLLGQHQGEFNPNRYNEEYTYYVSDDDVKRYANELCEAMETGLFVAVNHPDYFMLGRTKWSSACEEATRKIAACAARLHIPLEVNLKGTRRAKQEYLDGTYYSYPYRKFWEIASQYDIEVILGHDAHYPFDFQRESEIQKVNDILDGLPLKQKLDFRIKKRNCE